MITCPVCEHTQAQGHECENCGHRLSAPPAVSGDVQRLPDLEATPYAGGGAEVSPERVPELEQTRFRSGPDLPPVAFPEMERTVSGGAGEVDVPMIADLDTGRSEDDGIRTAAPSGPVTCRYCHHVQEEGSLCDRCGMRLPYTATPAIPAEWSDGTRRARVDLDDLRVRCKCGAPAKAGQRCGDCGEMVAVPSEA